MQVLLLFFIVIQMGRWQFDSYMSQECGAGQTSLVLWLLYRLYLIAARWWPHMGEFSRHIASQ